MRLDLDKERRIIRLAKSLQEIPSNILKVFAGDMNDDADQREAARRELLRRSLFANQERKAS